MKWWFFALFVIVVVLLFGLHALLFFTFTHENYLESFLLLFPAIILSAYLFLSIIVEPKESQDRKLEHLIKESLHELNLPIATIKANIDMLKRGEQEGKRLKRIERIESALERFKRLFNILSYNLKRELFPIEKEQVAIDRLLQERIEFFRELKRNRFQIDLEPLTLTIDKIGFEQVIDNLLENAVKYSPKESIIVVKLQNGLLKIRDYGIGIEASELPLIYQRYYQGSEALSGEGIGLAVVKRYCDQEGIGLRIDSQKGQGTEVRLDFSQLIQ